MELDTLIRQAAGREPADLLLTNLQLVDVLAGEIYPAEVAISGGVVAGVGSGPGSGYTARDKLDLGGAYLAPGLLDAHVHVESAMVPPSEFARAVVPRGTMTFAGLRNETQMNDLLAYLNTLK